MGVTVNFVGRLGADSELRTSKNGKQYVSMRVATDEFKKGERQTAWLNVTYANDRALKMQEFLKKGSQVNVVGIETVDIYQNKNGEHAISRDILADRVDFVSSGNSGETKVSDAVVDTGTFTPKSSTPKEDVVVATAAASSTDDDLPF